MRDAEPATEAGLASWAERVQAISSQLTDREDIRRAGLLVRVSLALAVILTVAAAVSTFTSIAFPGPRSLGLKGTVLLFVIAPGFWHSYLRSRRADYRQGAWLTIATIYLFLTAFIALYPDSGPSLLVAYAMPVLVATMFLGLRGTVQVFGVTVALGAASLAYGDMSMIRWTYGFAIMLVVTVLLVIDALVREGDLQELRRLRALEQADGDRLRGELDLARTVQLAMIPAVLPKVAGVELAAFSQSATEASGDYHDLFVVPHGTDPKVGSLVVVVCDVAGKGMASALVMSAARAAIRAEAEREAAPGRILDRVNQLLVNSIPPRLFLTIFVGVLDLATSELRFASGGHPHPHRWAAADRELVDLFSSGLPVGLVEGATYEEERAQLEPGDFVLAYTDGLVEAMNRHGGMYGFDDVRRDVRSCIDGGLLAQERLDFVVAAMERFVDGEPLHDDVTIVAVSVPVASVVQDVSIDADGADGADGAGGADGADGAGHVADLAVGESRG